MVSWWRSFPWRSRQTSLAAGPETGIDGQHCLLPQGRGQQELAQIIGEHSDGRLVGPFLCRQADFRFHGSGQEALVAVLNGQPDLLRGSPSFP